MRQQVNLTEYKKELEGARILQLLPMNDMLLIDLERDLQLCLFHNSFWRIIVNDDVIASSADLYAKCRYGNASWVGIFPPAIADKIEAMEDFDETEATELLENHINDLMSKIAECTLEKEVSNVTISSSRDIEVTLADNIIIQAFTSFAESQGELPFELLKGNS